MKALWPIFISIFIAELGDKTQIATLLFATDRQVAKWQVFLAAASALVLTSLLAVVFGEAIGRWVSPRLLKALAGAGFIAIGAMTLWRAWAIR